MSDFWLTEWLDNGAMVAGEGLDNTQIRNFLLANIGDNIKILNKILERIATILENEYERHSSV